MSFVAPILAAPSAAGARAAAAQTRQFPLLALTLGASLALGGSPQTPHMNNPAIALVIAPGEFRDEEYLEPKALFEERGARTVTVSTTLEPVRGMLGAPAQATLLLKDAKVEDFAAVVFVGGMGARKLYHEPEALRLARQAVARGKVVGAICLAPNILAQAGVLKNHRATAWAFEVPAAEAVNQVKDSVVRDGRIITANGPQAASPFAQAIVHVLSTTPAAQ